MAPPIRHQQGSHNLRSQYNNLQPSPRLVRYSIFSVHPTTNPSVPRSPVDDLGRPRESVNPYSRTAREPNSTASPTAPPITFSPRTYSPSVSTPPHLMPPELNSPSSSLESTEAQAGSPIEAFPPSSASAQCQPALQSNRTYVIRHSGTFQTAGPTTTDGSNSTSSHRPERSTVPGDMNEPNSASRTSSAPTLPESVPGTTITEPDQTPPTDPSQPASPHPNDNGGSTCRGVHFEDDDTDAASESAESLGTSTASSATEEIPRPNPFPQTRLRSERVCWASISTVRQVTTRETTVIELWREQVPRNDVFNDDDSRWQSSGDDTVLPQTERAHSDNESPENATQGAVVDDEAAGTARTDSSAGDQATQTYDEAPVAGAGRRDYGIQTETVTQTTTIGGRPSRVESTRDDTANNNADKRPRQATCEDESPSQAQADTVEASPADEHAEAAPPESQSSTADPTSVSSEEVRLGLNPLRLPTPIGAELKCCSTHGVGLCPQCTPGYASDNDESDKATSRTPSPSPSFTPGDDAAFQRSPRTQNRLRRARSDLKKRVEAKAEKHLLSTRRKSSRIGRMMPRIARKEIIRLERRAACNMMERRHAKARPRSIPGQFWLSQAEKRVFICEEQERERNELEQYYEGRLQDLHHQPPAPVKLATAVLQWARVKFG